MLYFLLKSFETRDFVNMRHKLQTIYMKTYLHSCDWSL